MVIGARERLAWRPRLCKVRDLDTTRRWRPARAGVPTRSKTPRIEEATWHLEWADAIIRIGGDPDVPATMVPTDTIPPATACDLVPDEDAA